jgi:hypothetical protein
MYIDPAGGGKNGDETVSIVSKLLHGYIYIPSMLAQEGGYDEEVFISIAEQALSMNVRCIVVEENLGKGAFAVMLRPVVQKMFKEVNKPFPEVLDDWVTVGKEQRIINTLEPIMARNKLVISPEVLDYDYTSSERYGTNNQENYQLLFQMSKAQLKKNALVHDDRLDCLSGAVRHWLERLNVNAVDRAKEKLNLNVFSLLKEYGLTRSRSKYGTFNNRKY